MSMHNLLKGVLNFARTKRSSVLADLVKIQKEKTKAKLVFFNCIDARVYPVMFTDAHVGDMFVVRNAGNMIPQAPHDSFSAISTEAAAIDLACVQIGIRDIVICGHSDCKAMQLLHSKRHDIDNHNCSPIELFVKKHGSDSIRKFAEMELDQKKPLRFTAYKEDLFFDALIDPQNTWSPADRLSMVNVLQQIQNVTRYAFIRNQIHSGEIKLHGLWFDVHTAKVYIFCRDTQQFVPIEEDTFSSLVDGEDSVFMSAETLAGHSHGPGCNHDNNGKGDATR